MPVTLSEQRISFTFSDDWQVVKFDDHRDFRKGLQSVKSAGGEGVDAKGLDFLGFNKSFGILLLEVKDFRGHASENRSRLINGLAVEVSLKCRDTVAATIGASRTSSNPQTWRNLAIALADEKKAAIKIVLWLESDRYQRNALAGRQLKAKLSVLSKQLKQKCCWLAPHALVMSVDTYNNGIPGIKVSVAR
jgi:hypothetical protein